MGCFSEPHHPAGAGSERGDERRIRAIAPSFPISHTGGRLRVDRTYEPDAPSAVSGRPSAGHSSPLSRTRSHVLAFPERREGRVQALWHLLFGQQVEEERPTPAAEREHSGALEPHTGEVCPPATYHIGVIEDIACSLIIAPASRLSDALLCPGAGMPPGSARFQLAHATEPHALPPHADHVTPAPTEAGWGGGWQGDGFKPCLTPWKPLRGWPGGGERRRACCWTAPAGLARGQAGL